MNGSSASVSDDDGARPVRAAIISVNWIGDTLMSAPAVAAWRRHHPRARLVMLARPGPTEIWRLLGVADEVWTVAPGTIGAWRAARVLRAWRPEWVAVCPHSVRSSWIAALSGASEIVGLPGPARRWLGIRVIQPTLRPGRRHQQFEYADLLFGAGSDVSLEPLRLHIPDELLHEAEKRLQPLARRPRLAVMPGAARGPAKRWPAERFAEVACRLAEEEGAAVVVLGGRADREAAALIVAATAPYAVNLAGETTVQQWAAVLSRCDLGLCNDSGGMHLAAAVGLPGVAIFGRTDPEITGPLSPDWTIVRAPGPAARDLGRSDTDAMGRLLSIRVDQVVDACRTRLSTLAGRRAARGSSI